ncbi:hypothetical protein BOFL111202_21200 [Bordetella flabilis]
MTQRPARAARPAGPGHRLRQYAAGCGTRCRNRGAVIDRYRAYVAAGAGGAIVAAEPCVLAVVIAARRTQALREYPHGIGAIGGRDGGSAVRRDGDVARVPSRAAVSSVALGGARVRGTTIRADATFRTRHDARRVGVMGSDERVRHRYRDVAARATGPAVAAMRVAGRRRIGIAAVPTGAAQAGGIDSGRARGIRCQPCKVAVASLDRDRYGTGIAARTSVAPMRSRECRVVAVSPEAARTANLGCRDRRRKAHAIGLGGYRRPTRWGTEGNVCAAGASAGAPVLRWVRISADLGGRRAAVATGAPDTVGNEPG